MARKTREEVVIDSFVTYLSEETRNMWQPSGDEVGTLRNNRKYGCEFKWDGQMPSGVEICCIFPRGSHPDEKAKRAGLIKRMKPELKRQGVGGLMLELPPIQKKHVNPMWPRQAAAKIRSAIENHSDGSPIEVEGFNVTRIGEDSDSCFFVHSHFSAYQPIEAAGYALTEQLKNKHDQLDVDGHRRFLITVNDGCRAHARDVVAACARIDFRLYPHFDRVYFEESPGRFFLVYDR